MSSDVKTPLDCTSLSYGSCCWKDLGVTRYEKGRVFGAMSDICVITTAHTVSSVRIMQREARTLVRAGFRVTLIAPSDKSAIVNGVKIVALQKPRTRLGRFVFLAERSFRLARRLRADAYHFHDPDFLPWALFLQRRTGRPVIYDVHEYYGHVIRTRSWIPNLLGRIASRAFLAAEAWIARRLAGVVVVNDHMAERFRGLGCRVAVLPNYPLLDTFLKLPPPRANEGTTPTAKKMIYVGGLSESRGITQCVRVLHRAQEAIPDLELYLVGKMEHKTYAGVIDRLVSELGLEGSIMMVGHVPHSTVIELLVEADVGLFLLQPDSERYSWGEPVKYFEYSAVGLPVIISDFPSKRALVEKNGNGILVDATDEVTIAKQLVDLLQDERACAEMGRKGREAFVREYNWEAIEHRLLHLYEEVLKG